MGTQLDMSTAYHPETIGPTKNHSDTEDICERGVALRSICLTSALILLDITVRSRYITKQVQGRQTQSFASIGNKGIATTSRGTYAAGQAKEKLMLVEAQEAGQILDEEKLAFIADPRIAEDVQEMPYSEQTHIMDFPDNEITSDNNIIPYSQYLQESQDAGIQDINSSSPNDLLVLSLVEQMTDHVAPLRVAKLEKDVSELKKINLSAKSLATLKS
ncbi:hypothetical protein Tco_1360334 [Tanacetum coccineum]